MEKGADCIENWSARTRQKLVSPYKGKLGDGTRSCGKYFSHILKGEECSREKKEVRAAGQNSISSSKTWVIIKSVALLRSNAVNTCLSASMSFYHLWPPAPGPLAANNISEFSSCTPYMIDADCHQWGLGLDCIQNELHLWKVVAIQTSVIQPLWFLHRPVHSIFYDLKTELRKCFI